MYKYSNTEEKNVDKKFEELAELVKPLQEWLQKNYDMMCKIILEIGHVEVVRGQLGLPLEFDD